MKIFEEGCPQNKIAIIWRRILSYLDLFDSLNAINIKITYIHTRIFHIVVDDKLKDSFDIDGDTGPCLLNRQFVGAYMLDSKSVLVVTLQSFGYEAMNEFENIYWLFSNFKTILCKRMKRKFVFYPELYLQWRGYILYRGL